MLTLAFCDCVGIQFISWGYQNVNEISHQAVPVNWVMNEHFISVLHATHVLVGITLANLFYTPTESIPLFFGKFVRAATYTNTYCWTKKKKDIMLNYTCHLKMWSIAKLVLAQANA